MSKKPILFFDLDDTILNLTELHLKAIKAGFDKSKPLPDCINKYIEIYKKNKFAFPTDIFQKVFLTENVKNPGELSKIANEKYQRCIDSNMNDYLNPDFNKSVEKLRNKGFEIGIITMGKEKIQSNKIEILKLKEIIDKKHIYIVDEKNAQTYEDIKKKYSKYECWGIGDREDGDVIEPKKVDFNIVRFRNPAGKAYEEKTLDDYPEYETLSECVYYVIKNYGKSN